jgi:hypothetical protein
MAEQAEENRDYSNVIVDSKVKNVQNRLLVGTPTLGLIRMEWAAARYGQVIPSNWSKVDMTQYMNSFIPMRYSVADGQNLIVQEAVNKGYEWLLFIEDDTVPPPDAFIRFNEYMREGKYPVVSGLYFTRSVPAEPMVYRGRGNSYFTEWKLGEKVMVDGVPTGMLLIDMRLMRAVWEDSPEYLAGGYKVRRVFQTPAKTWFNEEKGSQEMLVGTSDLDWCKRVIDGGYLEEHWPELSKEEYPFVIDTALNCMHIDRSDGTQFPVGGILNWCQENGNL